jgi:hypothetical protein
MIFLMGLPVFNGCPFCFGAKLLCVHNYLNSGVQISYNIPLFCPVRLINKGTMCIAPIAWRARVHAICPRDVFSVIAWPGGRMRYALAMCFRPHCMAGRAYAIRPYNFFICTSAHLHICTSIQSSNSSPGWPLRLLRIDS